MTENKRFEPDGNKNNNQYDYSILNSRYEANIERNEIIEWNKDACNAQYVGLERIAERMNFKQMQLEECRKGYEKLYEENEQLKQENSVFEGKDAKHYQRWVNQIKKYVEEDNPDFTYDEDFIIKIALSYTLQSLRNGESLKRFQWNYKELSE